MNAPENLMQPLRYDAILGENCRVLGIFGGQPEMLCSHETYQFNDYSRYETAVDESVRAEIRANRFPQDLQKAYDLGKRLVPIIEQMRAWGNDFRPTLQQILQKKEE